VLSSRDAIDLLVRRLEAAGWHVERAIESPATSMTDVGRLTPSARAR